MAFWVGKFTCLAAGSEVRGVVTGVGADLGENQVASTINIRPERNYEHMVLPPPAPDTVHLEIYETPCAQRDPEDVEWEPTLVFDPAIQANRPIRAGDRVRVTGAWVTDNHVHVDEPAQQFMRGPDQIWAVKTELHPYSKKSMRLIADLKRGETVEQTLTVCAPRFREVFSYGWALNVWRGLADGAEKTGQVVESSKQDEVTVEWFVEAAPPPLFRVMYRLLLEESVLQNHGDIIRVPPVRTGRGYTIRVTACGTNPRDPAVFQARYTVQWQLAVIWLVEKVWRALARTFQLMLPRAG